MIKLVAEIGINHNGDIGIAKKLIDIASFAGFDYVKFQKRTPELCVPDSQKDVIRSTPWGEMRYIDYKNRIVFGGVEYEEIAEYCIQKGVGWFASVWDIESAKFMREFTDMVKIPSAKITDMKLIAHCRNNFNHVQISTGMSTEDEVYSAVNEAGLPDVIYHTNSSYPAKVNELNLEYIMHLKSRYATEIGYSGHEWGLATTYAVALMVDWIERHVTLDHDMWGSDQKASIDPVGMIKLVRSIRDIEKAKGAAGPRVLHESEKAKREALR